MKFFTFIILLTLGSLCVSAQLLPVIIVSGTTTSTCPGTDTFTDTNGASLAVHNSCWSTMTQISGLVNSCEIQSNQVRTVGDSGGSSLCSAMYNLSSDSCEIIVGAYSDETVHKSCCVSVGVDAGTNKTGYCLFFRTPSSGNWTALEVDKAGAYLDIKVVSYATASPHTIKIVRTGTSTVTLTLSVDGIAAGTSSDSSSPYTTGKAGFFMQANGDKTVTGMDSFNAL